MTNNFYGVINGRECFDVMDFLKEARREDGEQVGRDTLKFLMSKMTPSEVSKNLFTKREKNILIEILDADEELEYSIEKLYKFNFEKA
jgi:hypothetical protein